MSRSGIQDISGSFNPGDSAYFQDISDNLTLRWSTVSDRAGCTLLSCLAPGLSEGKENEFALRYFEPYTSDTFYAGSSTNWAVCVDKAPLLDAPEVSPGIANSLEESPYVASLRKEAADAPERVVALVYFLPAEFTFERGSSQVPVAKAQIVACSAAYRQGKCGPNIMKGLFKMVHSRAQQTGCAFTITSGIPAYYGKHDYEYALNLGRGLITHTSSIATPGKTIPAESPYTMRVATLNDIPILESLIISSRKTAEIFSGVSSDALRNQLQWMLGQRSPPFDGNSLIYEYGQFFLLEKESKTVAAVGLSKKPNPRVPAPAISIHPLLWDGEEDAPVVVTALVQHLISAVNDILLKEGGSVELANIVWVVSDGHPLRRWLLAHELAIATPESSLYDSNGNWWINIPSPNLFLASIIPALNERLARATHIFGKHYTSELRISQYSTSVEGVIVRISNSVVTSVHGYDISSDDLETGAFGNGGPNVVLPHGALIQLLMGYKTWSQLKDFHPDVAAIPALVPLLEVLFPKLTLGSSLYF